MLSNTVKYALYDCKVWHFRGYNRHFQHPWKAFLTPLEGITDS